MSVCVVQTHEIIDNNQTCRICTVSSSLITFINVNKNLSENIKICDAYRSLTNLEISADDGYPQNICMHCKKRLSDAISLQLLAISSSKLLAFVSNKLVIANNDCNNQENHDCNSQDENHVEINTTVEENSDIVFDTSIKDEANKQQHHSNEISDEIQHVAPEEEKQQPTVQGSTKRKTKRKPVKRVVHKKVSFPIDTEECNEIIETVESLPQPDDDINVNENEAINSSAEIIVDDVQHDLPKRTTKKRTIEREKVSKPKRTMKIDDVERLELIHMAFQTKVEPVYKNKGENNITVAISNILSDKFPNTVDKTSQDLSGLHEFNESIRDTSAMSSPIQSPSIELNNSSMSPIKTSPNIKHIKMIMDDIKSENNLQMNEAYQKRKHSCQVCGKKFVGKSNLVDHLRYHANVKPYKCKYCGKSFVQSGTLKCHERTHTQEKPYKCTICPKSFSQASAKNVHMKTHTNERNHLCDVCDKGFITSGDLSKHKRTHETVKKFVCEICTRGFCQKVNYVKHKFQVHGIKVNN